MNRPTDGAGRGRGPAIVRLQAYVQDLDPSKRDAVFRILQSPERWTILSILAERDSVPLCDLIAALKRREPTESARSETQVEASLFHIDLPALADAGLVEWDTETHTTRISPGGRELVGEPPTSAPLDD